jgi:hypothetical protein
VLDPLADRQAMLKGGDMQRRRAALVVLAAALTFVSAAGGTSTGSKRYAMITAKGGVDRFTLVWLRSGGAVTDSGTVEWCCYGARHLVRDGQSVLVNDPRATFAGKRGTLVVRFRIEWLDAGNAYMVGVSTWKVIEGTGAYEDVTGGGRGAGAWLPRGPVTFQAEGFLTAK